MNTPVLYRLSIPFEALQLSLSALLIFISVIAAPRQLLANITPQANIPEEFRSLTFAPVDYVLYVFVFVSIIRFVNDDGYQSRVRQIWHRRLWFWVALILIMLLSVLWAGNKAIALFTSIHAVFCLIAAFFVAELASNHLRLLAIPLLVGGLFQSIIALIQSLNGEPLGLSAFGEVSPAFNMPTDYYRASALSMHPNYLGGYLMLALFALILLGRRRLSENGSIRLHLLIGGILLAGIVTTLSRSALLATGVGVLPIFASVMLAISDRLRGRLIVVALIAGTAMVIGVVIILKADWSNIQQRVFSTREFFLIDTFDLIEESPLLGVGAGNIMLEVGENRGPLPLHLLPVHNVYLYVWAEAGIFALLLLALACLTTAHHLYRPVSNDAQVLTAAFLAICIIMLFDNYFWAVHPHRIMTFYVLGLLWGTLTTKRLLQLEG